MERMIGIQIFLERIIAIEIESRRWMFHSEIRDDLMLYDRLDIGSIHDS